MIKQENHITASLLADRLKVKDKSICYVASTNAEALMISKELSLYLHNNQIQYFPEKEILPYDHFSSPESIIKNRFSILNETNKNSKILITSVKNLFERFPPKNFFKSLKSYSINDQLSLSDFKELLTNNYFINNDYVDGINQFSSRGGVVDFWPPIYQSPIRIEFFDQTIESIRMFDPSSQLTIKKIDEFIITTGSYLPMNDVGLKTFRDKWRDYFSNYDERTCDLFQDLNNNHLAEGYEVYLPLFFNETNSFYEIFSHYEFFIEEGINKYIASYWNEINQRYTDENIDSSRPLLHPKDLFFTKNEINNITFNWKLLNSEMLDITAVNKDIGFIDNLALATDMLCNGVIDKIVISTLIPSQYEALKNEVSLTEIDIKTDKIYRNGVNIINLDIFRPLINLSSKTIFLHREFFENDLPANILEKQNQNISIDTRINFDFNDYVIHENYGVGIYQGLETVETNKITSEYLKIMYANNENLYVPLAKTFLISKYHKNSEKITASLDSLSSNKWSQKKKRAEKRAYDHAAEILDIESRRQSSYAPSLKADKSSYEEFIQEFPYKETDDQNIAIEAIKKDLALIKPMNRLLCGDVGFGKTEIAMRAAFICVNANKQAVILAPSTVLVSQHYQSFIDRFKKFGINIQALNRYTKSTNKNKYINDFNNKKIDILIGTHALFNNSLNYKDIGLLIIDEEHRFGTKQKDIIKSKKPDVHILYLSATPIPRTMNFIFAGLKDFSFLHTPPVNRLSIKSFLRIENDNLISEAITREISRNGQCFIIQNDIKKLIFLKEHLLRLIPNLSIGIAHGQLNKSEITKTMNLFQLGKIDVLLCTTIVEMGLDIPNANTMIILDSYNFGLAQLHQLRGRVGRSDKQGYCYFIIPTPDIPKSAKERLDSIIRLSDLGAGFFIAQEDLELRGGGEILGNKQSGHIDSIGISLYLSMLKTAISDNNTESKTSLKSIEINFYDNAYIPEKYLPSPTERLKIYRRINEIDSNEELIKLKIELIDRCGKFIEEVSALFKNAELNLKSSKLGIQKISSHYEKTFVQFSSKLDDVVLDKILITLRNGHDIYQMDQSGKMIIKTNDKKNANERREIVRNFINDIT